MQIGGPFALLDSTPLSTIALVREGHPVIFPTGFARIGGEFVIHGSTGSPWLRALAAGAPAAASVTALDGVVSARSGFESSFRYRSAALFGVWAGVVPMTVTYGAPLTAPNCDPAIPLPTSVRAMTSLQ